MIERSNLVNISKLIVKELIEQSLRYGRMLDSDHLPLHHFFIVLEHVMRHGLKPKKVGYCYSDQELKNATVKATTRRQQITFYSDISSFLSKYNFFFRDFLVPKKSCGT